jgi:hypothetical protein
MEHYQIAVDFDHPAPGSRGIWSLAVAAPKTVIDRAPVNPRGRDEQKMRNGKTAIGVAE